MSTEASAAPTSAAWRVGVGDQMVDSDARAVGLSASSYLYYAVIVAGGLVLCATQDGLLTRNLTLAATTLAVGLLYAEYALGKLICVGHNISRRQFLPAGATAADVPTILAERDQEAAPVQVGAGSSVTWVGEAGVQTELCVLYIHGWSASPGESDPVDARVAAALSANSMRMRLSGHGLTPLDRAGQALHRDATCSALLEDAALALACARLLGRRVVIIAASTGATLALWLAARFANGPTRDVVAIIAISPALELRATGYHLIKWLVALLPARLSERVLELAVGPVRQLVVLSKEYERTWTVRYPSAAARHAIGLYMVFQVSVTPHDVRVPLLIFANPDDPVVSIDAVRRFVTAMPRGVAVAIEHVVGSEQAHNIVGRLTSPSTVERVVDRSVRFIRSKVARPPEEGARPRSSPVRRHGQAREQPGSGAANPPTTTSVTERGVLSNPAASPANRTARSAHAARRSPARAGATPGRGGRAEVQSGITARWPR